MVRKDCIILGESTGHDHSTCTMNQINTL